MIGSLSFQADMEILNGSHLSPGTTKHSFYHPHSESQEGRDSLLVESYTSLRVRLQLKETARHGESSCPPFGHTTQSTWINATRVRELRIGQSLLAGTMDLVSCGLFGPIATSIGELGMAGYCSPSPSSYCDLWAWRI